MKQRDGCVFIRLGESLGCDVCLKDEIHRVSTQKGLKTVQLFSDIIISVQELLGGISSLNTCIEGGCGSVRLWAPRIMPAEKDIEMHLALPTV